jgi:hypothetical protein
MPNTSPKRNSAGGAAAHSGINYQDRVAAWCAVYMLAELAAVPLVSIQPVTLRFETAEPVDDVLVATKDAGRCFVQGKRTIKLSGREGSELASVMDQFVRQHAATLQLAGTAPWPSTFDQEKDRLVLVTSSDSPQSIRRSLRTLLQRIRELPLNDPISKAALNEEETRALSVICTHLSRKWKKIVKRAPSKQHLRQLLRAMKIVVLDVGSGEAHDTEAKQVLRSTVLQDPQQANLAWATILEKCADLAEHRSGTECGKPETRPENGWYTPKTIPRL